MCNATISDCDLKQNNQFFALMLQPGIAALVQQFMLPHGTTH